MYRQVYTAIQCGIAVPISFIIYLTLY